MEKSNDVPLATEDYVRQLVERVYATDWSTPPPNVITTYTCAYCGYHNAITVNRGEDIQCPDCGFQLPIYRWGELMKHRQDAVVHHRRAY